METMETWSSVDIRSRSPLRHLQRKQQIVSFNQWGCIKRGMRSHFTKSHFIQNDGAVCIKGVEQTCNVSVRRQRFTRVKSC